MSITFKDIFIKLFHGNLKKIFYCFNIILNFRISSYTKYQMEFFPHWFDSDQGRRGQGVWGVQ
jgi:hypothetical protein